MAQLACGHNQHVRHNPPWTVRPWVIHSDGRQNQLGQLLECVKCDQNAPVDERPATVNYSSEYALAHTLGNSLRSRSWNVSCAESCTGGLIAAAITDIPGSSYWFAQSWVTYSNASKQQQLGVSDADLVFGAVSQAVVESMAAGAQRVSGAQCAIATSGIAGPDGGTLEKPVGTVWIAWTGPWGSLSQQYHFPGDRQQVRKLAVENALSRMIALLED